MCGGGYAPPTVASVFPGAMPLVWASPFGFIGPKAAPRAEPKNVKGTSMAGHSHRRTSGGKAEAAPTQDF